MMLELRWLLRARRRMASVMLIGLVTLATACDLLAPVPALVTAVPSSTPAPTRTPGPPTTIPAPTSVPYTPVFDRSNCQFEIPTGAIVDCGFLVVPQDRSGNVADTIRLAVAVYRSRVHSAAAPVVYLQGGPGAGAVSWSAGVYTSFVAPLLQQGDVVMLDQRGTGLSQPALRCDEISSVYLSDLLHAWPASERQDHYLKAFLACRDRLTGSGAKLAAYTTVASAADVRDLAAALGYPQINLYGVSYGTRLAQAIMRDDPGIVRSVVVDSVLPLDLKLYNTEAASNAQALEALFKGCAANTRCNAAYPELGQVFAELATQLNAKPLTVAAKDPASGTTFTSTVDGTGLTSAVIWALHSSDYIPAIPRSLYRLKGGDDSFLSALQTLPVASYSELNLGVMLSINCHEQIFATTPEELEASQASHLSTEALSLVAGFGSQTLFTLCQQWGAAPRDPRDGRPLSSDIPTLLFVGEYDPTTPPANARQLAAGLTHSYLVEFPRTGHAPSFGVAADCSITIALGFLNDPSAQPNSACLGNFASGQFAVPVTLSDQIPMQSFTSQEYGLSGVEPSGWKDIGSGFSNRNNSPLDPTQLGIQSAQTSIADWLKWVTDKWAKQGLDAAPKPAGQRQAGGHTWKLYTATFQHNPVDLAFTVTTAGTAMVGMVSASDEHEALLKLIFVPIIEAIRIGPG
jgi:pimeloyl-ACP methyl ester carboxylesterase